jgi:hypothetical protein
LRDSRSSINGVSADLVSFTEMGELILDAARFWAAMSNAFCRSHVELRTECTAIMKTSEAFWAVALLAPWL